jgi:hypothetical protein
MASRVANLGDFSPKNANLGKLWGIRGFLGEFRKLVLKEDFV